MPTVLVEHTGRDASHWENASNSDEGPEDMDLNDHETVQPMCPDRSGDLPRSFKSSSREFLLYHAILDQVLIFDTFVFIDWTKIAEFVGYNGRNPINWAKGLFAKTWREFHGGRTLCQQRRGNLTKQAHLLLAMLDDLSGRIDRPRGNWTKLASALGYETEAAPRMAFKLWWGKYLKITRPECIVPKKSRGEKMDEWIADMFDFDDGDDDEEPLPLYEEHDSRESKTGHDEIVDGDSDIEVVTTVIGLD